MKLVTFAAPEPRAGALVDETGDIVDLAAAHRHRFARDEPSVASVLAIIEGGPAALEVVRSLLDQHPDESRVAQADVRLLAPVPRPVSVRDFLCFERHMLQGFENARKVLAEQSDDPEKALADIDARRLLRVPDVWYRQPIYYRGSALGVCGPDTEVEWPRYSH